jgi:hypothetical protein
MLKVQVPSPGHDSYSLRLMKIKGHIQVIKGPIYLLLGWGLVGGVYEIYRAQFWFNVNAIISILKILSRFFLNPPIYS